LTTENDLVYWLALWRQPYIGPGSIQKLLAISTDLSVFFTAQSLNSDLKGILDPRSLKIPLDWKGVQRDIEWMQACEKHHILKVSSRLYPARLKEVPGAPSLLFVKGDMHVLSLPQMGMVGSRHPTPVGFEDAYNFAYALS